MEYLHLLSSIGFISAMELILRVQRVVVDEAHKAFWEVFRSGKWEEATLDTFDRHLNRSTVFLDIGAWIGPTALYAAARAKRVIAIEADPVAAGLLRKNVALNPLLAERIEIIERAVSPESGTLRMGSKGSKGDSMSSIFFSGKENSWEASLSGRYFIPGEKIKFTGTTLTLGAGSGGGN